MMRPGASLVIAVNTSETCILSYCKNPLRRHNEGATSV